MKINRIIMTISLAAGAYGNVCFAEDDSSPLTVPGSFSSSLYENQYWLSDASEYSALDSPSKNLSSTAEGENRLKIDHSGFEEPWWSGNKFHQYMGLGALALVGLAAISPKEEGGPHEYFATASAVMGAAAVTSGLVFHWEDFDFSNGWSDPDNLHMLIAGLGALGMMYAVSQAPDSPHAGVGAIGGIAMGVAIKMEW